MAVGKKNIKTKLIDVSTKLNFESVMDGTGKPLGMSDSKGFLDSMLDDAGAGELGNLENLSSAAVDAISKNEIATTISEALSSVGASIGAVVDGVLKAAGGVIKSVGSVINSIVSKLGSVIKAVVEPIARLIGVIGKGLGKIISKAFNFVKSLFKPVGAFLKDKVNWSKIGSGISNFFKKVAKGIVYVASIAATLLGIRNDKPKLTAVTDKLLKDKNIGIDAVSKAYRFIFDHEPKRIREYYGVFEDIPNMCYTNDNQKKIWNYRYNDNNYKTKVLSRSTYSTQVGDGSIFVPYHRSKSKLSTREQNALLSDPNISKYIPQPATLSNKSYKTTVSEANSRSEFSNQEQLAMRGAVSRRSIANNYQGEGSTFERYSFNRRVNKVSSRRQIPSMPDYGSVFEVYKWLGRPKQSSSSSSSILGPSINANKCAVTPFKEFTSTTTLPSTEKPNRESLIAKEALKI